MKFNNLPSYFMRRIGMKLFVVNNRDGSLSNLWCFCSPDFDPQIVEVSNQHVAFTVLHDFVLFGFAAIYASTSHNIHNYLWNSLSTLLLQHSSLNWCFCGDFNDCLVLMSIMEIPLLIVLTWRIFKFGFLITLPLI